MMIRFLIKGLLRDKSRSLFPVLTITSGVFLIVFLYNFMQGVFSDYVKANAQFDTGHVKVMTQAYSNLSEQLPNDLAILGTENLLTKIHNFKPDMIWTPRIRFGGLLDIPDAKGETRAQGPVNCLGVNLLRPDSPEIEILNLEDSIVSGNLPKNRGEILISEEFASRLGVKPEDKATLISSTMYGGMAIYNLKISGLIRFGMTALDKGTIIVDINDARSALDMEDGASEILGYTRDMLYNEERMKKLAEDFNNRFSDKEDEFSPVMIRLREQGGLGEYMDMGKSFSSIIVGVFVIAMSIVLWNSGLLNSLRRYGEIGVRLAMGEPKGTLYRRMIAESFVIGVLGSIVGTVLGVAISYYLQHTGIDYGDMMQKSSVLLQNEIRARVTPTSYVIGFLPGVIASVLGTCFAGIGIYHRKTSQLFKELEV